MFLSNYLCRDDETVIMKGAPYHLVLNFASSGASLGPRDPKSGAQTTRPHGCFSTS